MAPSELIEESVAQWLEPGTRVLDTPEKSGLLPNNSPSTPPFSQHFLPVRYIPASEMESSVPATVNFAALRDPKFRMSRAIPLTVSREDQGIVVCWDEISEFGTGESFGAALDDFSRSISDLHKELNSPNVNLGPDLLRIKGVMSTFIQAR